MYRREFLKTMGLFVGGLMGLPLTFVGDSTGGARGTDYYVDQTAGLDTNDGLTTLTPWKTISKVQGFTFAARDRVNFKRGETWAEKLTQDAAKHDNVIFKDYGSGALPIITGSSVRDYCIDARGCNGNSYRNLSIQSPTAAGIIFNSGTHFVVGCTANGSGDQNFQHLTAANVIYMGCTITGAVDDGISIHDNSHVKVLGCTITGNAQGINFAAGAAVLVVDNCTFANTINDILPDVSSTVMVYRSIFTAGTGASTKSVQGPGTYHYCIFNLKNSVQSNTQIASVTGGNLTLNNCTIYGYSGADTRGGLTAGIDSTFTMKNCIVLQAWRAFSIASGAAANLDYCDLHSVTTEAWTTNTHDVAGDPLFTDAANGDFTLQVASPCRDAGVTYVGQPTNDYAGNPVRNPPSLGALEYV